eukprot:g9456.t7
MGLSFESIPNGLAALTKVPGQGWAQIVAFLGTYELFINKPVGDEPGNYGKGNLGLGFFPSVADPEAQKRNRPGYPVVCAGLFLLLHTLLTGAEKRRLALCPLIGYGCAWIGHFFVEHNKPASFKYPTYSFRGDWVMVWMMLLGKMDAEVISAHQKLDSTPPDR